MNGFLPRINHNLFFYKTKTQRRATIGCTIAFQPEMKTKKTLRGLAASNERFEILIAPQIPASLPRHRNARRTSETAYPRARTG